MPAKKPVVITVAHEAATIAADLIPRYHRHLMDASVLILFTTADRKKNGNVVLGTCSKNDPVKRYLSGTRDADGEDGYDFLILLAANEWPGLSGAQRVALVDHELSHAWLDEDGVASIRSHDLEDFNDCLARNGLLWQQQVTMAAVMQQLPLDGMAPKKAREMAFA